ncbi:5'-nucleotidase C-terminal domain-containing protein [Cognatishimia sp. SS12]|uniref:5'-nucleotidase C-terminal domain-containing protein n=1 Tax=Cognatishimia sp. SS12 TaxID=2979465 RepID=UPI00232B9101|nr:5'-nucleotidase C-terminal domain-containing protein [Cognatishimia sp. SS12]MDC0739154.1 5'-nucleotidase C-terminal domain-containing protein [Cognatishimia sp. SS12]
MAPRPKDHRDITDLTVLATADLHGAITHSEANHFTPRDQGSLAQIGSYVTACRDAGENVLLLDNGDFLQGSAICDVLASVPEPDLPHPMITAMNHLGYDAVGLGNHEFDYGMPVLRKALADAAFPILCSNVTAPDQGWRSTLIIHKTLPLRGGGRCQLKIGLFSVLPQQTVAWNAEQLDGAIAAQPMLAAAQAAAQSLKAQGADLIIALAHTGIAALPTEESARDISEHVGLGIAALPEVDIMICGHAHRVFPADGPMIDGVDNTRGLVCGTPTVMPGFNGSHLGAIRLTLARQDPDSDWQIEKPACEALAVKTDPRLSQRPEDAALLAKLAPALNRAQRQSEKIIGRIDTPIQSYFSRLPGDPCPALTALAALDYAKPLLAQTDARDLPVLAVGTAFRSGGRAGPHFFTDVAPGSVSFQDLFSLYPFLNTLCVLRITGAGLRRWLDMAASNFNQIQVGSSGTVLQDLAFPCYAFDCIFGLTYAFDISQPACFAPSGERLQPLGATRVRDLRYAGRPVEDTDEFLLLTSGYRAGGGGNIPGARQLERVPLPAPALRSLMQRAIRRGVSAADLPQSPWRFSALPGTSALYRTGPAAAHHAAAFPTLAPHPAAFDAEGFALYPLDLSSKTATQSLAIPDTPAYIQP